MDAVSSSTAKGGMAIVEDTRTGGILAIANVTGDGAGNARPSIATEHNRAITDVYEPGSTNKVITISGAIEDGLVTPDTRFIVPDKLPMADAVFEDHEPHPPISWSVTDILVNSSNVGTILIGEKLGKVRIDHYLRAYGFGKKTNVGFPGEPAGILLDPDTLVRHQHGDGPDRQRPVREPAPDAPGLRDAGQRRDVQGADAGRCDDRLRRRPPPRPRPRPPTGWCRRPPPGSS